MIRRAALPSIRARLAARLAALGAHARRGFRRASRPLRAGRLIWIVDTGVIGLQDVARLERLNVRQRGRARERSEPGLLEAWCDGACRGRFRQLTHTEWAFSHERDARLFNMIWGTGAEEPGDRRPRLPA